VEADFLFSAANVHQLALAARLCGKRVQADFRQDECCDLIKRPIRSTQPCELRHHFEERISKWHTFFPAAAARP
jgi:hypothetical protein